MLGGHSPVLNWAVGMWSEPDPLVLEHVPSREAQAHPCYFFGVSGVVGCSSFCAPLAAPKSQQELGACAMELEVLWLLGSLP